jgi:transposase
LQGAFIFAKAKQTPDVAHESLAHLRRYLEALFTQPRKALGWSIPITLVLDNARYQKCAVVMGLAQSLNIELLYLTAYSPNLNLIERLWKFVKKQCLYSIYYPDFSAFKASITSCLNQCHTTYKEALDSLLTLRFQSFKKVKAIA